MNDKVSDTITNQTDPKDDPGFVVLTRRRLDWYFLPSYLVALIFGAASFWWFGELRLFASPAIGMIGAWVYLRFLIPCEGIALKRISSIPGMTAFLIFLGIWLVVGVIGSIVFARFLESIPFYSFWSGLFGVGWIGVLLWWTVVAGRKKIEAMTESPAEGGKQ